MTIIIDTNVLIALLIKRGTVREIIINNPGEFVTPEWCFEELWEHKQVWNRKNMKESQLKEIFEDLKEHYILSVPRDDYITNEKEASKLIDDPDDIAVIALALAIDNQGIWTFNTRDFLTEKIQKRIKILSTKDVIELYPMAKED